MQKKQQHPTNANTSDQQPQVSYSECHGCEERRICFYGYCAKCLPDSPLLTGPKREQSSQPLPASPYDEQATTLIMRWIDSNETAEDIICQIITRAYEDAAHMCRSDPDPIEFYQPRTDAGDAIREYFDSENPFEADREYMEHGGRIVTTRVFDSLILYALDRVDWYEIVDHLRERMAKEDEAVDLAEAEAEQTDCPKCGGNGYESIGPLNLNCPACYGTGLVSRPAARLS